VRFRVAASNPSGDDRQTKNAPTDHARQVHTKFMGTTTATGINVARIPATHASPAPAGTAPVRARSSHWPPGPWDRVTNARPPSAWNTRSRPTARRHRSVTNCWRPTGSCPPASPSSSPTTSDSVRRTDRTPTPTASGPPPPVTRASACSATARTAEPVPRPRTSSPPTPPTQGCPRRPARLVWCEAPSVRVVVPGERSTHTRPRSIVERRHGVRTPPGPSTEGSRT